MSEPTYTYLKGVGWIPVNLQSETWEEDGYRITLMAREPAPGDKFWICSKDSTVQGIRKLLKGTRWDNPINSGARYEDYVPDPITFFGPDVAYFVVKIERL